MAEGDVVDVLLAPPIRAEGYEEGQEGGLEVPSSSPPCPQPRARRRGVDDVLSRKGGDVDHLDDNLDDKENSPNVGARDGARGVGGARDGAGVRSALGGRGGPGRRGGHGGCSGGHGSGRGSGRGVLATARRFVKGREKASERMRQARTARTGGSREVTNLRVTKRARARPRARVMR